jgi:hypothetical protein
VRRFWAAFRHPVHPETAAQHAAYRARLPAELQAPHQMLGRQGRACGATIGAMPRCDFACRGCYLGDDANRIPPASVDAVKRQMDALRPALGRWGNLQLTDGEVTLRDEAELVELLRYAAAIELTPMLMTHGDAFRRRPGLLERLMVHGGLRSVSIHVDTTQRGRTGAAWRSATDEAALNPLREEFAALIRAARRTTGRPLFAATTVTVSRENLGGVPAVVRCVVANADAFGMLSFQPMAQVGRTEDGLGGGVSVDELWSGIAEGVGRDAPDPRIRRAAMWLGHPDCNRFVHGVVARDARGARFHPARVHDDPTDRALVDGFLARFGGIAFDRDRPTERVGRMLGVAARAPWMVASGVPRFAAHWLRRLRPHAPVAAARDLLAGRLTVHGLALVSHHFMGDDEVLTARGQERIAQCVFHVPVDGALVSMCAVNATARRREYYATLARAAAPAMTAAGGAATATPPDRSSP